MVYPNAFHKFDAREILPVAHGLLEQCFMRTAEIRIDFIGYDAKVPYALLFSRGSSCDAMVWLGGVQSTIERNAQQYDWLVTKE